MTSNGLNQPSAKQQVVSLLRDLASQIQKMDDSGNRKRTSGRIEA